MLASIIIAFFGYLVVSRLQRFGYKDKYQAFNFLILLMAFAIIFGVELVRIKGDIDRMNTVFKFYLQAWVLYGIAGAFIIWYLATSGFFRPWRQRRPLKSVWLGVMVLLLISSFVFPVLGDPVVFFLILVQKPG